MTSLLQSILSRWTTPAPPPAQPSEARPARKNNNLLYAQPLPLQTYPLPAFLPANPLSYLRVAAYFLSLALPGTSSHTARHAAHFSPLTLSVHVTDAPAMAALWRQGFFGKGSLSRSEPEWLRREAARLQRGAGGAGSGGGARTAADVTNERRRGRREEKRLRAARERAELEEQLRAEGKAVPDERVGLAGGEDGRLEHAVGHDGMGVQGVRFDVEAAFENEEHLQLTAQEAFFLAYGLGVLDVYPDAGGQSDALSTRELLGLLRRTSQFPPPPPEQAVEATGPDDEFMVRYAAYHHFRSLGWVVRPGIKFAVDYLLYARGPVFAHAEFAVVVLPSYSRWGGGARGRAHGAWRERSEWWYLHAANRVQNQVLKTLVVAYVEVPPPAESVLGAPEQGVDELLAQYAVREFVVRRWTANRNRE